MGREYVPFDGIWSMAIDVPVSYLLRDGDLAWSCGQLALDVDSNVLHPGDLGKQSEVVADYIEQVLARANLSPAGIARLYLYHAAPTVQAEARMLTIFRQRFGASVALQPIAVPHFYYDGVLLEVDVWWSDEETVSFEARHDVRRDGMRLSEHLVVPTDRLGDWFDVPDPGAVIDGGASIETPVLLSVGLTDRAVSTKIEEVDGVVTVSRQTNGFAWVQGRCTDADLGLVEQTEAVMGRIDAVLASIGLGYTDVAKSTTHYVGGSSAAELHDNMAVRNRRYSTPGPASTGLPVYGFADPASKIVVDITLVRRD